jgi:prepilin-type N-terminal cleavage/methylation domain-containing protein
MNKQSGFTLIELLIGLAIVVFIALAATVVWVAVHFIAKFW